MEELLMITGIAAIWLSSYKFHRLVCSVHAAAAGRSVEKVGIFSLLSYFVRSFYFATTKVPLFIGGGWG